MDGNADFQAFFVDEENHPLETSIYEYLYIYITTIITS